MTSPLVTRATALLLALGGIVLLFAGDVVLPLLVPDIPAGSGWVAQTVAAGWLAMAALDWQHRGILLGGIYGRPVTYANVVLHTVTSLSLLMAALRPGATALLWGPCLVFLALAVAWGILLVRGPFDARPGAG
jgi:hypothetical protein